MNSHHLKITAVNILIALHIAAVVIVMTSLQLILGIADSAMHLHDYIILNIITGVVLFVVTLFFQRTYMSSRWYLDTVFRGLILSSVFWIVILTLSANIYLQFITSEYMESAYLYFMIANYILLNMFHVTSSSPVTLMTGTIFLIYAIINQLLYATIPVVTIFTARQFMKRE